MCVGETNLMSGMLDWGHRCGCAAALWRLRRVHTWGMYLESQRHTHFLVVQVVLSITTMLASLRSGSTLGRISTTVLIQVHSYTNPLSSLLMFAAVSNTFYDCIISMLAVLYYCRAFFFIINWLLVCYVCLIAKGL